MTVLASVGRFAGRLLAAAVTLYGVALLALLVITALVSEDVPVLGILRGLIQVMLLPVIVLFPLALLGRRWRLALLLVPALAGFLALYGIFLLPRATATTEGDSLRLLIFNLKAPEGALVAPLVAIVRDAGADVVALQEVTFDAAAALEADLAGRYPYRALHPHANRHAGQGVLSRFPILADEFWTYPGLGHQQVVLDVRGRSVTLINTHPVPPFVLGSGFNARLHSRALDDVLARAERAPSPVLLAGDFNMTDRFDEYAAITRRFDDAYRVAGEPGFGFTFPAGWKWPAPPFLRLDYIFYDASFQALSARVLPDAGTSDHFPLLARLALRGQE